MGVQSQNTCIWSGWRTSKVLCSAEAEPIEKKTTSTFVLVLSQERLFTVIISFWHRKTLYDKIKVALRLLPETVYAKNSRSANTREEGLPVWL